MTTEISDCFFTIFDEYNSISRQDIINTLKNMSIIGFDIKNHDEFDDIFILTLKYDDKRTTFYLGIPENNYNMRSNYGDSLVCVIFIYDYLRILKNTERDMVIIFLDFIFRFFARSRITRAYLYDENSIPITLNSRMNFYCDREAFNAELRQLDCLWEMGNNFTKKPLKDLILSNELNNLINGLDRDKEKELYKNIRDILNLFRSGSSVSLNLEKLNYLDSKDISGILIFDFSEITESFIQTIFELPSQ